jgi:hypothetical protein
MHSRLRTLARVDERAMSGFDRPHSVNEAV